jgi:hypothetical protein
VLKSKGYWGQISAAGVKNTSSIYCENIGFLGVFFFQIYSNSEISLSETLYLPK